VYIKFGNKGGAKGKIVRGPPNISHQGGANPAKKKQKVQFPNQEERETPFQVVRGMVKGEGA